MICGAGIAAVYDLTLHPCASLRLFRSVAMIFVDSSPLHYFSPQSSALRPCSDEVQTSGAAAATTAAAAVQMPLQAVPVNSKRAEDHRYEILH